MKSKITGEAAHIYAAQPGGPRYDPNQSPTDRRGIGNAIWLCMQCAGEIDKDTSPYPTAELLVWKSTHESYIAQIGSMGFRRAFLTAPATQDEVRVASRMISFFEDRRVLSDIINDETPTYVRHSVERIREQLWEFDGDLPPQSELRGRVKAMRTACLTFMDDVGHIDSIQRIGDDPLAWKKLFAELAGFRKSIGLVIGDISEKFSIPLSTQLSRVVPSGI